MKQTEQHYQPTLVTKEIFEKLKTDKEYVLCNIHSGEPYGMVHKIWIERRIDACMILLPVISEQSEPEKECTHEILIHGKCAACNYSYVAYEDNSVSGLKEIKLDSDFTQDCKEIAKYFDALSQQTEKDGGNLWIQLSDKFNHFEKKYSALSQLQKPSVETKEETAEELLLKYLHQMDKTEWNKMSLDEKIQLVVKVSQDRIRFSSISSPSAQSKEQLPVVSDEQIEAAKYKLCSCSQDNILELKGFTKGAKWMRSLLSTNTDKK